MVAEGSFAAEIDEIGRIDFLLDQLARAVESGEVPLASYEAMAPRYLARRQALVATITGASPIPARRPVAGTRFDRSAAPGSRPTPVAAHPRRESKPVKWTTVLTFLGAFFVVVAAAIFAIVIWDVIGVGGKLLFMGGLTALFYAGGWYANRLGLRAGATALTVVASAMLLFEGWIVIDGFNLTGPLPWSVVLLVCSLVYWFTEVLLASTFFGVVGSAAQIGWWWLLGEGLALPVPVRLAGMAVIAALWALAAERGRADKTVGSLAQALEWIAPLTQAAIAVGLLGNLAFVRSADVTSLYAAAVAAGAGGLTVWRSRLIDVPARPWLAAALQIPLFAFVWAEWGIAGPGWSAVGVMVAAALVYDWLGVTRAGAAFAVPGMLAEATVVAQTCAVLEVDDRLTVLALALLGAVWAASARLASRDDLAQTYPRIGEVALAAEVGSILMLTLVSVAVPFVSGEIALAGHALARSDALLALGVLAAWYAAATVSRRGHFAFAGSVWAFYALAAVLAWALPDQSPDLYATALMALAGVWLLSAKPLAEVYGPTWSILTRAASRVSMALIPLVALEVCLFTETSVSHWMTALLAVGAASLAVDAVRASSRVSAAGAAVFATAAASAAGGVTARGSGLASPERWAALAGAWGGFAIGLSAGLAAGKRALTPWAVAAAAAASTCAAMIAFEHPAWLAVALAGSAAAWTVAAWRADQWFAGAAGLAAFGSLYAAIAQVGPVPGVTVTVLGVAGLAMGVPAFTRSAGPGGPNHRVGAAAAISGLVGLASVPFVGIVGEAVGSADSWYRLGPSAMAGALAVLGAGVLVQSVRWRIEPGYYAGGFVLVLAIWTQLGTYDSPWIEAYTTPLALYFVCCGYLRHLLDRERPFPVITDIAAVASGLAYPMISALNAPRPEAALHALIVFVLALVAIGAGVGAKSRWYFFGGVAVASIIVLYRSFTALAEFWWLLLGVVGVAMLVIALTWERQRMAVADTRERLKHSFEGWR